MAADDTYRVQDPQTLRAVAHPLRQRILTELSVLGHARAADLARVTGEPANSISFHLRVLARAGLVVEAPEHARDRRDRVWRNVATSYQVEPGTPGLETAILQPALAWVADLFARAGAPTQDDPTAHRTGMLSSVPLTAQQAEALATELTEFLSGWTDRAFAESREDPDQPRTLYQVLVALGPQDPTPGGTPT